MKAHLNLWLFTVLFWVLFLAMAGLGVLALGRYSRHWNAAVLAYRRRVAAASALHIQAWRLVAGREKTGSADSGAKPTNFGARLEQMRRLCSDFPPVRKALGRLEKTWKSWQTAARMATPELRLIPVQPGALTIAQTIQAQEEANRFLDAADTLLSRTIASAPESGTGGDSPLAWMLALAVLALVGILAGAAYNQQTEAGIFAPLERMGTLLERVTAGETYLRIPVQHRTFLQKLARPCNRLIETMEQLREDSLRRIQTQRMIASALAESSPAPVLVLNPAGEVLFCNTSARELLAGEPGRELLRRLREQVKSDAPGPLRAGKQRFVAEILHQPTGARFPGFVLRLNPENPPARSPSQGGPSCRESGTETSGSE